MARMLLFLGLVCGPLFAVTPPQEEPPEEAAGEPLLFTQVDWRQLGQIEIIDREGSTLLERRGDVWFLPRWRLYPAEPAYVQFLIETLAKLTIGKLAAVNPVDRSYFGLADEAKTLILRHENGNEIGRLQVGKGLDHYRRTYLQVGYQKAVRVVDAQLVPALYRSTWAKRTLWRFEEELLTEIVIRGFSKDFQAAKDRDGQWRLLRPAAYELSDSFFTELLPRLTHLRAGHVSLREAGDEPLAPMKYIQLTVDEIRLSLDLGKRDATSKSLPAWRQGEPVVFHLSAGLEDDLDAAIEALP